MSHPSCRICVSNQSELVSLHNAYYGDISANEFIKRIFSIEMDTSLDMVCKRCNSALLEFYNFYKMVNDAQQIYAENLKLNADISKSRNSSITLKDEKCDSSYLMEEYNYSDNDSVSLKYEPLDNDSMFTENYERNQPKTYEELKVSSKSSMMEESDSHEDHVRLTSDKDKSGVSGKCLCTSSSNQIVQANLPHFEEATKTLFAKYSLDEISADRKTWSLNEEDKEEAISLFISLKCAKCTESSFLNMASLVQHYRNVHKDSPKLKCCRLFYADRSEIEKHILYKHILKKDLKRYKYVNCPVCHKSIKNITMKYHLVKHLPNDKRDYQCDLCNTGFASKWRHTNHMKLVHSDAAFPCDHCAKIFKNKPNLMNHIKKVHSSEEGNILLCPGCGKRMKNRTTLTNHLNKHYGVEEKVKCHICNIIIKRISLNRHMRLHDPKNLKQCPHCSYQANSILEHVRRVHEKIKPHACAYCPMKFRELTTMNNHIASRHTGIPKYRCEFCEKTFMCAANSITHSKRMHSKQLAEKKLMLANSKNSEDILDSKIIMKKKYNDHTESEAVIEDIKNLLKTKRFTKKA